MSALTVLQGNKDQLAEKFQVAPGWMQFESEYSFAIQQLSANNFLGSVAEKNKGSLLSAMANVAACGLTLNPAEKQAYLVPRQGKVCLDPSYMGLIKLATDTGSILWAQAKIVYANDVFTLRSVDEKPIHETNPFGDRGDPVGVYCTVKTHDGSYLTEAMSVADVNAIRDKSEAYKKNPEKTPWHGHWGEMAKKTVTKRAHKYWPRSDNHEAEARLAQAVQISNDLDEVKLAVSTPNITDYSDEDKAYFDQLIESGDALEMFVFSQTKDPGVMANLYNSFEKGTITKYKNVVRELEQRGYSQFQDYLAMYNPEDDAAIEEIKAEVSDTAFQLIKDKA